MAFDVDDRDERRNLDRMMAVRTERLELRRYCEVISVNVDVEREDPSYARAAVRESRFRLVWEVLSKKKTEEHSWPADWWQAFKDRWFPKWALRRWPVRRTVLQIEAAALFPEFKPPPGQHRVEFHVFERKSFR